MFFNVYISKFFSVSQVLFAGTSLRFNVERQKPPLVLVERKVFGNKFVVGSSPAIVWCNVNVFSSRFISETKKEEKTRGV